MIIEKVVIETGTRYEKDGDEDDDHYIRTSKMIETLTLKIPLPGGLATYIIDLPKEMKENLEFAAQLSKKS